MTEPIEVVEKPKKKRVNSKGKGNGFENQMCKTLSEHLAPLKFRRSQSSGAILGGDNARFMENYSDDAKALFVGDVVPTNESDVYRDLGWKFKFTLECKFYKTVETLEHLFANTKIKGWFEQAATDAAKIHKHPLLIFKFNRTEIFCATDANSQLDLPVLERRMYLKFPDGGAVNIFLLKEALLDLEWWKVRGIPVPSQHVPLTLV